jgi:hypothetical protein
MYSRKHQVEEIPEEMTEIWTCSSDSCKSWMRDNFAFEVEPVCTQCQSPMTKDTKMLPQLTNNNLDNKFMKKRVPTQSLT